MTRGAGPGFRRAARLAIALAAVTAGLAGCAPGAGSVAPPTWAPGPTAPSGPQAGLRGQLATALSTRNLILDEAKVPFRPAEPPELAAIPRTVYRVQLRDDPTGGFIVAYHGASPQLAAAAGTALATYLSSGPGRVQSPLGTVHVIRQAEATLLYYRWLPEAAPDPLTPGIQEALETIGTAVPVPR